MNRLRCSFIALVLWALVSCLVASAELSPVRLRCEYRENPEGIGEPKPRLSWRLEADRGERGVRQSAYQIRVASAREALNGEEADLWDSGKVNSDRTHQVVYGGRPLTSRQACWWSVRVWDEQERVSAWSEPARWSVGLLGEQEWIGTWIGLDAAMPGDERTLDAPARERVAKRPWVYAELAPSPSEPLTAFLRRSFVLPAGRTVERAVLAVIPDQVASVHVNGRAAGELTRWEQIQPVDVTPFLTPGENVVGLAITQRDGHPPAALGELHVQYSDGTTDTIAIDATWTFSGSADEGWTRPQFDASRWSPVVLRPRQPNPWSGPPQTFTYWFPPATYLRKAFTAEKPVRRAVVYATALGAYELHLNGERVGRDYLTPGWTDFHRRVHYQTYDVTALVRRGDNALGAILADGWYASVLGYTGRRYFYGGFPRFLAQLEIEYDDGSRAVIASDGSWKARHGPIVYADLMAGAGFDARRELPDWATAAVDDKEWQAVMVGTRPLDPRKPLAPFVVQAATADASRVTEELPARTVSEPRPGAWTFDLGQNIVGWVRLKVRGRPGQKVVVRHGEALNPNGTLYTSNLRGANATDVYWLRGGGDEVLEPPFTFHGFRYVEVTGLDYRPDPSAVTGRVVHSIMERTGEFACSNPLVNQLFANVLWGQRGNYLEIPTDCPQRDERAGWSGDAQFFIRAGTYNFDVAGFFTRWLDTLILDTQLPSGAFGNVAPLFGRAWTSAGWSDAALVCVHTIFRVYGDTRLVDRHYAAMERYMEWVEKQTKDGIVTFEGRGIGDHLNLDGGAPTTVIETAYYAYLSGLMAEMAEATGRASEAQRYAKNAQVVREAFQRNFFDAEGRIKDSGQVGYALAFAWGLVPDERRHRAAEQFVELLRQRDWHLGTGFIGTPRLLPALSLAGRDETAYRVLLQESYPGWLFQVKNGATTVWERWDGWTPEKGFQTIAMNSFNHYAFGSVAEYLYRFVGGIDAAAPGFREILIRPAIAEGLTWARTAYDSISGRIATDWKLEGTQLTLAVEVPPNTTALVQVPTRDADSVAESGKPAVLAPGVSFVGEQDGRAIYRVGSGRYEFTAKQ